LKSDYFIQKLFDYIHKRRALKAIRYNKSIQKRTNININHYKEYSEKYSSIEIEIKPVEKKYGEFINIKEEDKEYYHIYYNDNKKEQIKNTSLNKNDKVSKINIIIDYQVESFYKLFYNYECIESICFKKFYRNNIIDMSCMFMGCSSLIELNINNFNTNNVTDMSGMFSWCSSLKELNINNFNTNNVTNMCSIFSRCSSLKVLNLNNFNTNNVNNMRYLFYGCSSLKVLNLNNFNTNNVTDMKCMFSECSDELKLKIKSEYNNFKEEAFKENHYYYLYFYLLIFILLIIKFKTILD